jgi:hypothetical protein
MGLALALATAVSLMNMLAARGLKQLAALVTGVGVGMCLAQRGKGRYSS